MSTSEHCIGHMGGTGMYAVLDFDMSVIEIPEMLRVLRYVEKHLVPRDDRDIDDGISPEQAHKDWLEDSAMLREVQDVLEAATTVPE